MSHSTHASETIQNPGRFEFPSALKTLFIVFIAIGVGTFAAAVTKDPSRAWASFLQNYFYFLSLALGGAFFAAIQWATNAMWSAPVRRLAEGFTAYLPIALVLFIVMCFGLHSIYVWTHPEHVQGDPVLEGKSGYLSIGFFVARNLVALLAWIWLARKMIKNSVAQDANGEFRFTLKNRVLAPTFIGVFAITYTMASFDLMMSLDPHWFSTMFGVYCFAGLFYSTLAATCLAALYFRKNGKLEGIVNDNHMHDLGKFMFSFAVFWAYIGFSQFMLIWYANMPEETVYFLHRFTGGWLPISIFLLIGKFLVPFFILIPRDAKRNPTILKFVAWWMLLAQWVDMLWIVQPEFFKDGPVFLFHEFGIMLGFVGLFGFAFFRFLSRHNIVAIGDPRLAESVHHHHQ